MRKHLMAILLPIVVAVFAYIYSFVDFSNSVESKEITCNSSLEKQCLLENRKRKFSQKWEMVSWRKYNFF